MRRSTITKVQAKRAPLGLGRMRSVVVVLFAVLLSSFSTQAHGAGGQLDSSFSSNGTLTTDFGSGDAGAGGVVIQPDGKIVAVGYFSGGIGNAMSVARYGSRGGLDGSFGDGGKEILVFDDDAGAADVAIQEDGRIVLVGSEVVHNYNDFLVVRLRPDGSVDPRFGAGGVRTTRLGTYDDSASAAEEERLAELVADPPDVRTRPR